MNKTKKADKRRKAVIKAQTKYGIFYPPHYAKVK